MAIGEYLPGRSQSPIGLLACAEEPDYVEEDHMQDDMELPACQGERSLFEEFLRVRAHCRGALAALSPRLMIVNASAGELIQPSDRPRMWALAQEAVKDANCRIGEVSLSNGASVRARYRPILHGGTLSGVLLQFTMPRGRQRCTSPATTGSQRSPVPGWSELTNTERTVAEVVASGLTNREAARRAFMSPHTVDAHLRHIFQKLGISSRVQLALLVGQHHQELCRSEEAEISLAQSCHPSRG